MERHTFFKTRKNCSTCSTRSTHLAQSALSKNAEKTSQMTFWAVTLWRACQQAVWMESNLVILTGKFDAWRSFVAHENALRQKEPKKNLENLAHNAFRRLICDCNNNSRQLPPGIAIHAIVPYQDHLNILIHSIRTGKAQKEFQKPSRDFPAHKLRTESASMKEFMCECVSEWHTAANRHIWHRSVPSNKADTRSVCLQSHKLRSKTHFSCSIACVTRR